MSRKITNAEEKNSNDRNRLIRMFPEYFEQFNMPPQEAREEIIEAYRACRTNKLERESFLSTYEENGFKFFCEDDQYDPSTFSMSVYEKPRDVKRFAVTNSDMRPPYAIAKGNTLPIYGKVLRTKEYKAGYKKSSHIDWWLYQDAEPYNDFELIDDFKEYLEERKRG